MHFSSSVLTCYCRFDGFYRRTEGSLWQCLGCPASFLTSRGMRRHLGIFRWRDRDIEISKSVYLMFAAAVWGRRSLTGRPGR